MHNISDDEAECARIEKELSSIENRLSSVKSKLSNEKFTANAKPEIVEAERQRLADLERSYAAAADSLEKLRK